MAGFSYAGKAVITWADGSVTRQYIDFDMSTNTLAVWPEDITKHDVEYLGTMADYPAKHIRFLHL